MKLIIRSQKIKHSCVSTLCKKTETIVIFRHLRWGQKFRFFILYWFGRKIAENNDVTRAVRTDMFILTQLPIIFFACCILRSRYIYNTFKSINSGMYTLEPCTTCQRKIIEGLNFFSSFFFQFLMVYLPTGIIKIEC